jgi:hypothetical protein
MGMFQFCIESGQLSAEAKRDRERVAEDHGCSFVQTYNHKVGAWRSFFLASSRGVEADKGLSERVSAAVELNRKAFHDRPVPKKRSVTEDVLISKIRDLMFHCRACGADVGRHSKATLGHRNGVDLSQLINDLLEEYGLASEEVGHGDYCRYSRTNAKKDKNDENK